MSALYIDIETRSSTGEQHAEALDPTKASIYTLCVYDPHLDQGKIYCVDQDKKDLHAPKGWQVTLTLETALLESFWQGIKDYEKLFGFGISAFDIPFIAERSSLRGVAVSDQPEIHDLQQEVLPDGVSSALLSLKDALTWHRIQSSDVTFEYTRLLKYIQTKEINAVLKHCRAKALATERLRQELTA